MLVVLLPLLLAVSPPKWVDYYTEHGCKPNGGDPAFAAQIVPDQTRRLYQVLKDCPVSTWLEITTDPVAKLDPLTLPQMRAINSYFHQLPYTWPSSSNTTLPPTTRPNVPSSIETPGRVESADSLLWCVPIGVALSMAGSAIWSARRSPTTSQKRKTLN